MRPNASPLKPTPNNPMMRMRLPISFEVVKDGSWGMTEDGKWVCYRFHDLVLRIGPFILSLSIGRREKQERSDEELNKIVDETLRR